MEGCPEGTLSSRESDVSCGAASAHQQEQNAVANAAEQNFSTEIFTFAKVIEKRPRAIYELKDLNATTLDGQFNREELTPVLVMDRTVYKIDKILDRRVT